MSGTPDISVLIVSYNGREELGECLRSLFETGGNPSMEVIVSDNGSRDGSQRMVRQNYPAVTLIENGENIGFGRANNAGLPLCRGEYVLLLNPDTRLTPGALSSMAEFMNAHPDAAAAGPMLVNADGSLQRSIRRFPSLRNQLSESLFLHKVFRRAPLGEVVEDPAFYRESRAVDWVTGAAMLVRRRALDEIGGFDERFFLYSEETDWCFRAHLAGWKIYFFPGASVLHVHGDSGVNPLLHRQLLRSKFIYFDKHFSRHQRPFLKMAVVSGLAIRVALAAALVPLRGFKGEKALGKLRVSWFALMGLLRKAPAMGDSPAAVKK